MEAKWRLRRIGIRSSVKIATAVSAAFGFIIGAIWFVLIAFFSTLLAAVLEKPLPAFAPLFALVLPFLAALFYGVIGALLSFVITLLYNIAAGLFGGIELDLGFEKKEETDMYY